MTIEAEALRVFAPAKINLFLHVGDKRADGYHALESLVVFTRVSDELRFSSDREFRLAVEGPFAEALKGEPDNLVLKAGRALAAHAGQNRGAYISLRKQLPVASGIGGGSADAAAALRGLARLWNLQLPRAELREIAAKLGSDIPVCVDSRTAWMEGRGETLTLLDGVPPVPMVLVNPGVAVPTGNVFAALKERRGLGQPRPSEMKTVRDLIAYLKDTTNDLEAPARAMAPEIGDALEGLTAQPGALLTRMSGSGATCFSLFADPDAAEDAAEEISSLHPGWWVVATHAAS